MLQAHYEQLIAAGQRKLAQGRKASRHSKRRRSTSSQEEASDIDDEESESHAVEKASLVQDILKAEKKLQQVPVTMPDTSADT